jgi:hypothetical protein
MISLVRALSTSLLALFASAAVACSNGGGSGAGGSTGNGAGNTSGGDTGNTSGGDTTGGGNTGSTGSGSGGMDWSGTWTVDLSYGVSCDFDFDNIKTASWTQTDTMVLAETGSGGVSASFPSDVNYGMSGTGNDHQLTLAGQYPAKDNGGAEGSTGQDENTVTLKIDSIAGPDMASGSMSGQFVGEFGQKCTIMSGTAGFSR